MDASLGNGASNTSNICGSSSIEEHYDPDLDSLLCHLEVDYQTAQFSLNDVYNELSNAPSAPPECKLQPRVYRRSPSLTFTYTPPPSSKVVELQCLPVQPLTGDMSAPSHPTTTDLAAPVIMPHHRLPSDVLPGCDMPSHSDVPSQMSPSHSDVPSHVSTPNMPPHHHISMPPPPCVQFPNFMCSTGSQSHDPHHNFTFSFSDVEAKHKNQLPYHPFHDTGKLAAPEEVPRSPITCGTASPAYQQSSTFSAAADSDSAAMEMSSASTPSTPTTWKSSFYRASTQPPEWTSLSVPPSPTPSVNKKESTNVEGRSSPRRISAVAFKVKTKLLNLDDGFKWKKYGEKKIKTQKYPR